MLATPSCIFSENLVDYYKKLQDFQNCLKQFLRMSENCRGTLQYFLLS